MYRLFAVGDIHGQVKMLQILMQKIKPSSEDRFVFLGDYIDRGLFSKEVIEYLLDFQDHFDCIFLKGNHEDMLLDRLDLDEKAMFGEAYLANGGMETIRSYCGQRGSIEALKQNLPAAHITFFKQTKLFYVESDYIFVHGGIVRGVPIKEQKREDILWLRHQFISNPTDLKKTVVFGHTPQKKVLIQKDKIGVDTGAGYRMSLSAIELLTKKKFKVSWQKNVENLS